MYFLNPIYMGVLFICSCIYVSWIFGSECIWAATWQNQQNGCAPSEDSDQPGHPPSLIRVFAVRMKKHWVLSYALSAARSLIRLGGCPGWSESSLGAHSFYWFFHVVVHMYILNIKSEMRSFKSNENIHKKEGGSYYVVSANKASSVTL